jgi:hypothetical protein
LYRFAKQSQGSIHTKQTDIGKKVDLEVINSFRLVLRGENTNARRQGVFQGKNQAKQK